MEQDWPKLLGATRTAVSPWLEVISRDVQLSQQSPVETYYAIGQQDYLVGLAVTPDSSILLVRQYRPAIERFNLEFPGGLLEGGEDPASAMARELFEETGHRAQSITLMGTNSTCSCRISNTTYSFFIETETQAPDFVEEPGVSVRLVSAAELRELIFSGEFAEQGHLGVLGLALSRGLIRL